MFEFVCGIDDAEDDEFATADYRSLQDLDGWQRRDPWEAVRRVGQDALP